MPDQPFATLLPAAARTAAGTGEAFDLTPLARSQFPPQLLVQLDVTAISGTATPTINMLVEDSVDGVNWNTVGTFAAATTVAKQVIAVALSGVAQAAGFRWPFNPRRVRCRWTTSGTNPSLTCNVKAAVI